MESVFNKTCEIYYPAYTSFVAVFVNFKEFSSYIITYNMKYDINFLRFLSKELSAGIFDHKIAQCLFNKIGVDEIKENITEYFKNDYKHYSRNSNIYVHIPYCTELCTYCHCNAEKLTSKKEFSEYLKFLLAQIRDFSHLFHSREISSIWFGGGTPSLLSEKDIRRIFDGLYSNFQFKKEIQVNFEASLASLTKNKIKVLKECGLNRLSLGVQSLDKVVLREVSRRQDKAAFYECVRYARNEKIPVLNIDLIAGLPNQSIRSFLDDLNAVIKLRPESIHINPFSDVFTSRYYQERRFDVYRFVRKRHIMMLEAKKMLAENDYKRYGFEAYQRNAKAYNFQQLDTVNNFSNIFAFGINSLSTIFDKLIYKCRNWECIATGKEPVFSGCLINERYAKARFMIMYLWKGFESKDFYNVFGENTGDVFKEELYFLENMGLISMKNGGVKYMARGKIEELFDYFAYTNIFYGKNMLSALKKHFRKAYNPRYKYDFLQDGFFPKISDHYFMLTYYEMGY